MHIIKPPPLRKGQTIAVISPAGPAEKKRVQSGLQRLKEWGFRTKMGQSALDRSAYFSATDAERFRDLLKAFRDPAVKAILCTRGGYGSGRLLSNIPFDVIAQHPKIFVGFSDLTVLNWALYARAGLVTFTGPLVSEMGEGLPDVTIQSFFQMMQAAGTTETLGRDTLQSLRPGTASGRLFPGCLSLVVTLLGTPFLPNLRGAILMLEEIDEKPYQIDRMLTHLKNAGVFNQISALIIGRMVNCWPRTPSDSNLTLEEILLDLTADRPIPIYTHFPYGHHPERITLPVGIKVEITAKSELRRLENPFQRSTAHA